MAAEQTAHTDAVVPAGQDPGAVEMRVIAPTLVQITVVNLAAAALPPIAVIPKKRLSAFLLIMNRDSGGEAVRLDLTFFIVNTIIW